METEGNRPRLGYCGAILSILGTGRGRIVTPSRARGNFDVVGGIINNDLWGNLEYQDHGTGLKVHGTGVTAYVITGETMRHIEGSAEVNGQPGFTYQVNVADNSGSGPQDTFAISLSSGYGEGRLPASANIQLHRSCKTAPSGPHDPP